MQVRQYPFQIDAPLSPALRDTMLVASFVARACRSVLRARDQRVRAARVVEVPARAPAEVPAFRSALGECGIEVVEFDQTLSSLMADPEKAPTVKELVGSLAGKRAAAPDLGARVQELLARCGATPRKSGMATVSPAPAASPPQTSPGPQPSAASPAPRAAPAASRRDRPRSKDFRWDLTAAARASEGRLSPDTEPLEAAAPSSAPAPDAVSGDVRVERTAAQGDTTPTTAGTTPDERSGAPAPTVPPATATNGSPATGPVAPPLKDAVVPTEVGIVVVLEELGRQSENLQRRVEAIEALVVSQARRLEEAERKLEAVLRRIEAREEAARKQAEHLARTEQELAELRERVARVEARHSEASPLHATPAGPADDTPPIMAAAATEDAKPDAPVMAVQPTTGPGVPSEDTPIAAEALTAHPSSTPAQTTGSPEGAATAARPTGDASTFAEKAKSEAHVEAADSSPAEGQHVHAAQPSQQLREAKLHIAGMERRLQNAEERLTSTEAKIQNTTKFTERIEEILEKGG